MTLFRPHDRLLVDSLDSTFEFEDFDALFTHVQRGLNDFNVEITPDMMHVNFYCIDDRIGWDTHIVIVDSYGIQGYTDGPVKKTTL